MPSPRFQNYLRANRKRLALSQGEVAFLMQVPSGDKVSRHELLAHIPTLEAALAYEVIYKRPVSELFSDLYRKVEAEIADRAKILAHRKDPVKTSQRTAKKRQLLTELAESSQ